MLTPEYLSSLPEPVVALLQELEEYVVGDIARRLQKASTLTETAEHQLIQATSLFDVNDLLDEIAERTDFTKEGLKTLIRDALKLSQANEEALYRSAGVWKEGMINPIDGMLNTIADSMAGDVLNLTRSLGFAEKSGGKTVFKPIAQFYQSALNNAQMQVLTGVTDYNTAVREVVKKMAASGLRTVDYSTGYTSRVDVAARRAVISGVNKVSGEMTNALADELGCDLMEITAHAGARPSHAVWQGKIVSRSSRPGYLTLDEIGYGEITGFMGANCRHTWFPFFDGISQRAYTEEELENLRNPPTLKYGGVDYTAYEASQMQRKFESAIRQSRDRLAGYDAADLKDDFTAESIRLHRLQDEYKKFSSAAGLYTQNERLQTLGFGRSVSSKATWANRKAVERSNYIKSVKPTLPKVVQANDAILQNTVGTESPLVNGVVPKGVTLRNVRVIAGYDTSVNIRAAKQLANDYGGDDWKWQKKTGTIKTDYYQYEVHWYEYAGKQHESKPKGVKKV